MKSRGAFRQIVVIALGVFCGLFALIITLFFLANCERFVDGFNAGRGDVDQMEEYRRKYPPKPQRQ